ncbi:MAG: hypothetical protein F4Y38_12665 [Gemmatimonadetes bacterium]|nr:hypothetical protein [Gemmatimonadota bacterium]MYG84005.1 hypothetical protein [Gemmatimonadota bacterium]MYJ88368.1 hypothetical protein [Gemmatimonadota bacterium]
MKHPQYFVDFLKNEVNLNPDRLETLKSRSSAVGKYLRDNLGLYRKTERQGSYATETIIKPVNNHEYDADLLLYMKYDADKVPREYIEDVYSCLKKNKTYKDKIHRKTHCVIIDYTGDFHLDLVPCIESNGSSYVCNRQTNKYELTDGTGYRDWFIGKSRKTNGHLKRVVRLLKYLRDIKQTFSIPSIVLTTLVAREVLEWGDENRYSDIPETLKTISNRINGFLQANHYLPSIANPVIPSENLATNWSQDQYTNFRSKFDLYNSKINDAYAENDHNESVKKWRSVFGEKFGKLNGTNTYRSALGTTGITSSVTPRKQHAGLHEIAREFPLNDNQIQRLLDQFPRLRYEPEPKRIVGGIDFCAYYDTKSGKLEIGDLEDARTHPLFICDSYEIKICLNSVDLNGWPAVYESGGRHYEIATRYRIPEVDLHFYPNSGACCLGIRRSRPSTRFDVIQFVADLVIPFLYRLSYVDKFGLEAARRDLWGEYSHSDGIQEYITEMLVYAGKNPGRNTSCPCGSGKKYKNCHMNEVEHTLNAVNSL